MNLRTGSLHVDILNLDLPNTNQGTAAFGQPWNVLQLVTPDRVSRPATCLSFPQVRWRNERRDRPL